uniref:BACK domain-containing protein n=1 Tax=Panagrolaimus davidi TaxID=227884 RepID=A0A914QYH9_9BILA
MYFVPLLKKKCFDHIEAQCYSFDGIFKWCEYGIIYENECPDLLELCFKKLSETAWGSQLLYCEEKLISAEMVERIAKDCPRGGYLTEDTLFVKIFEWGKEQCKQQKVPHDSNGIKHVISPILKHIKLKNISIHSWINIIQPNELAPQEECYKVTADYAKIYPDMIMQLTPKMTKDSNDMLGNAVRATMRNDMFGYRGGQRRR